VANEWDKWRAKGEDMGGRGEYKTFIALLIHRITSIHQSVDNVNISLTDLEIVAKRRYHILIN